MAYIHLAQGDPLLLSCSWAFWPKGTPEEEKSGTEQEF